MRPAYEFAERHGTCRQDKSQLVRAGRRPLRGVFLGEDVSLQIGQVHHSGGVPGHPRGRDDLVGDEGRPDGLPLTASARPAIGVAVAFPSPYRLSVPVCAEAWSLTTPVSFSWNSRRACS